MAPGIRRLPQKNLEQAGFTLVELAVAILILMFGCVAVMQLVPAAMQSNLNNRYDTTATVVAQRFLDLAVSQRLDSASLVDDTGKFPCTFAAPCQLGRGFGTAVGDYVDPASHLAANGQINFQVNPVNGYSFTYVDVNDPTRTQYRVMWAAITTVRPVGPQPNVVVGKRVVVGARRVGTMPPTSVTLSSWVSR